MLFLILTCLVLLPAAIGYAIKFGGFLFEGLAVLMGAAILLTGVAFAAFGALSILFG